MNDYPTSTTPIQVRGLREVCEINGRHFNRRKGTQEWSEYKSNDVALPPTDPLPLYISLAHEIQGPGEPLHWSLYIARESQPGVVYQVRGDAEFMGYQHIKIPVDITSSESFGGLYQLAAITEEQAMVVEQIANSEAPPKAENRASVKENCQGWTIRVLKKLIQRGIVPAEKLQMATSMMEPI